jgi:hypothetical protein
LGVGSVGGGIGQWIGKVLLLFKLTSVFTQRFVKESEASPHNFAVQALVPLSVLGLGQRD